MRRFLHIVLLLCVISVALLPAVGQAQDVLANPASGSWLDVLVVLLKAVMPTVAGFLSGLLTKGINNFLVGMSPNVGYLVSTILGVLTSGLSAAGLGAPVAQIEAQGLIGAGAAVTGHVILQNKPIQHPAA